jgi:hypothetical protein
MDRAPMIRGSNARRAELMAPKGELRPLKAQGPFYRVSGQKRRLWARRRDGGFIAEA